MLVVVTAVASSSVVSSAFSRATNSRFRPLSRSENADEAQVAAGRGAPRDGNEPDSRKRLGAVESECRSADLLASSLDSRSALMAATLSAYDSPYHHLLHFLSQVVTSRTKLFTQPS
jgi:hypothetical protein